MIVVDVQMLVYATIQGQHTKLTERVSEADPRWVAPRCGAASSAM